MRAVILELLDRERRLLCHDIRRDDLAAQLVRYADDGAFRNLGMLVEHGLDLRRINVFAG